MVRHWAEAGVSALWYEVVVNFDWSNSVITAAKVPNTLQVDLKPQMDAPNNLQVIFIFYAIVKDILRWPFTVDSPDRNLLLSGSLGHGLLSTSIPTEQQTQSKEVGWSLF